MSLSDFESRLELLKKNKCSILPLGEAVQRLYSNDLPERSVALTFDDGFYNFYKQAYPLLKSYGMPATVYLTTHRCYYNNPIFRLLASYMLWKRRGTLVDDFECLGSKFSMDLRTADGSQKALDSMLAVTDGAPARIKDTMAKALANALNINYEELISKRILNLMNPQEVAELSSAGIDFQLHTHTHNTPRDHTTYLHELSQNRAKIHEATGTSPTHFCYPSGIYNSQFVSWLGEENVVTATTCDPGIASPKSKPLLLPRFVDTSGVTPGEFEGWLSGVASIMSRRR